MKPLYVPFPIPGPSCRAQTKRMNSPGSPSYIWKSIRVELAETGDFPKGSPSRAYMFRLPLLRDGTVHEEVLRGNPSTAGFRRFWPNEPDRDGFIVPAGTGWALAFRPHRDGTEGEKVPIAFSRLLPGDGVTIGLTGDSRPFRVVNL